jgi:hypothetical protein
MDLQLKGSCASHGLDHGHWFRHWLKLGWRGCDRDYQRPLGKRVSDAIATIRQKYPQAKLEACAVT